MKPMPVIALGFYEETVADFNPPSRENNHSATRLWRLTRLALVVFGFFLSLFIGPDVLDEILVKPDYKCETDDDCVLRNLSLDLISKRCPVNWACLNRNWSGSYFTSEAEASQCTLFKPHSCRCRNGQCQIRSSDTVRSYRKLDQRDDTSLNLRNEKSRELIWENGSDEISC